MVSIHAYLLILWTVFKAVIILETFGRKCKSILTPEAMSYASTATTTVLDLFVTYNTGYLLPDKGGNMRR